MYLRISKFLASGGGGGGGGGGGRGGSATWYQDGCSIYLGPSHFGVLVIGIVLCLRPCHPWVSLGQCIPGHSWDGHNNYLFPWDGHSVPGSAPDHLGMVSYFRHPKKT